MSEEKIYESIIDGLKAYIEDETLLEKLLSVVDVYVEGRLDETEFRAYIEQKLDEENLSEDEVVDVLENLIECTNELKDGNSTATNTDTSLLEAMKTDWESRKYNLSRWSLDGLSYLGGLLKIENLSDEKTQIKREIRAKLTENKTNIVDFLDNWNLNENKTEE